MLSSMDFIRQSLEIHLFFLRIMKEHSFFLEVSFTPRDINFTNHADNFRMEFDKLLGEVISLSNGVVRSDVLKSGEVVTPYTLKAETISSYYTGIRIPTQLTQAEIRLMHVNLESANPMLERRVTLINQRIINLITALIQFKTTILSNVLSCSMFTFNYPSLVDHIIDEAKFYLKSVRSLQNKENVNDEPIKSEKFWNEIMEEHAKFIRGLLDPSENELINAANNLSNQFEELTVKAKSPADMSVSQEKFTNDSLKAAAAIRDFKIQGTQGLLQCKIKSIIIPLLADHTLREANHYLRLLNTFAK